MSKSALMFSADAGRKGKIHTGDLDGLDCCQQDHSCPGEPDRKYLHVEWKYRSCSSEQGSEEMNTGWC